MNIVGCCSIVQSLILQYFNWVENATVVKVPQLQGDQIGESLSMDRPEPKFALFLHSQFFFHSKRNGHIAIECKLFTDDRKDRFDGLFGVILNGTGHQTRSGYAQQQGASIFFFELGGL